MRNGKTFQQITIRKKERYWILKEISLVQFRGGIILAMFMGRGNNQY